MVGKGKENEWMPWHGAVRAGCLRGHRRVGIWVILGRGWRGCLRCVVANATLLLLLLLLHRVDTMALRCIVWRRGSGRHACVDRQREMGLELPRESRIKTLLAGTDITDPQLQPHANEMQLMQTVGKTGNIRSRRVVQALNRYHGPALRMRTAIWLAARSRRIRSRVCCRGGGGVCSRIRGVK